MDQDGGPLPPELYEELMTYVVERDGQWEVIDMAALLNLIVAHGAEYPQLLSLVNVKEGALEQHYRQTGEVFPGVKIVKTETEEGSNVTKLEVLRGPIPPKP